MEAHSLASMSGTGFRRSLLPRPARLQATVQATMTPARPKTLVGQPEVVMRPLSAPGNGNGNGNVNGSVDGTVSSRNGKATSKNGSTLSGASYNNSALSRASSFSSGSSLDTMTVDVEAYPASGNGVRSGTITTGTTTTSLSRSVAATTTTTTSTRPATGPASVVVDADYIDRPSDADFKWAQDDYNVWQRTADTWSFFTVFRTRLWLLDQKWAYVGGYTEEKRKEAARSLAKYLLSSVLALGPTFIKLGQLGSSRSDIFPVEFVEELATLQDRVPAFSGDKAVAIIEKDLGAPIERLFKSFDRRPIAAASLGQVHRAVLLSGEQVAIKVQRPGLRKLFEIDLNNLRILSEQLDKGDENRDFKGIYQECAQVLLGEVDYLNEGRSADRFRRNFRDTPWVQVPKVYWEYCSPRILTLEYMPGIKITDKAKLTQAGLDLDTTARRATECYLQQMLQYGFFHADPHPGNIAVDPSTGNLIFYDFGMMGEIVPDVRQRLLDMFYGIYRKDTNQVVRALIDLKVIKPTGDILSVKRAIAYFVENINKQAERQETIANIGEDLFAIAVDQPFRFPATFTFVLRAFSTLEGICKQLNPDYKFAVVATPYAQELLSLQDGGDRRQLLITQVQQQAQQLTTAAAAMPLTVQRIGSTLEQLESGDLKLRVRVLEAERAARRAGVLQMATMNTIAAVGLANMGVSFAVAGVQGPATLCMAVAGVFGVLVARGFKRVQSLDKFEKDIRSG